MEQLILVVDDNEDNVAMLSRWLKRRGHRVMSAQNGLEAVALTREHRPNLVFMDVSMPVMSGEEATRVIRSDESIAQTPVIAVTAHAMTSDKASCLAAGYNDVVTKPIDFSVLQAVILKHARIAGPFVEEAHSVDLN